MSSPDSTIQVFSTSTVDDRREPLTGHLQVTASPSGNGLGDYLGKFGIPHQLVYLGMIRIINPPQLINKIAPRITVEEEGDKVILDDGGEPFANGSERSGKAPFWSGALHFVC